jgi:hypothetical protein
MIHAGLPMKASGLPMKEGSLPMKESGLPMIHAGLPMKASGLPMKEVSVPLEAVTLEALTSVEVATLGGPNLGGGGDSGPPVRPSPRQGSSISVVPVGLLFGPPHHQGHGLEPSVPLQSGSLQMVTAA